jgi:hypothetical protein
MTCHKPFAYVVGSNRATSVIGVAQSYDPSQDVMRIETTHIPKTIG